ncbi:MAG: hypothetical protein AT713_07395 [Caldivirga sp. JCHS_4]|jgi:hypothetical protein|nr:MAG: hypothetical protein AT713_07395 [Caldivirga sp. JCHS_4]
MLKPGVLLGVVRVIETIMVIAIMYLYGINALAFPYIIIPMLMLLLAIIFLLVKLVQVMIGMEPTTAQRLMLVVLVIDLLVNLYLVYLSMVTLSLVYIMTLYMVFFINVSITLVLIALYAKLQ